MQTVKQLLKNYLADIQYLYDYNGGYLGVNEMSCGTPSFQSDREYQAYVANLKNQIAALPD